MEKRKVINLITVFFVMFTLSGAGTILDLLYLRFPDMFWNFSGSYEILKWGTVHVYMPGVPYLLAIIAISVFVHIMRRFYKYIINEIKKENA